MRSEGALIPADHVAIIGAGFSGTLLAIHLLRQDRPRVTLIERGSRLAHGVAYGAAHPSHLLNVRANNMSALPKDPDHFVHWLAARGQCDASAFVPRQTYGVYLGELLDMAAAGAGDRLTIVRGDAVDLADDGAGIAIRLADGGIVQADAGVLALGNLPPPAPPGLDPAALGPDRYIGDPWAVDVAAGLDDGDDLLLIGTGLTAVDIALTLDASGFRGRIIAMSRRGLTPRTHAIAPTMPSSNRIEQPSVHGAMLVRTVRTRAQAVGWRAAIDELRPYTQAMWQAADIDERHRFLRHLRPWWDVHRHRLAPAVADRIEALRARGSLSFVAGKPGAYMETAQGVRVTWRPRGTGQAKTIGVRRIINCTGPQSDPSRTSEPLLARLLARGMVRPDPCRLGLDVDAQARLINIKGQAQSRLYALGPMTRGAFWEIVAVPDIRQQTWALARWLADAHQLESESV